MDTQVQALPRQPVRPSFKNKKRMDNKKKPQGKIHWDLEISKISSHAKEEMEGRFCLYPPAVYRKPLQDFSCPRKGRRQESKGSGYKGE